MQKLSLFDVSNRSNPNMLVQKKWELITQGGEKLHYIIDGYNLLFRLLTTHHTLAEKRRQIIENINEKIELLGVEAVIIFDSNYQTDESLKSHFAHLEIQFTKKGLSADDWIIQLIERASFRKQKIVVTSDKKLASIVRQLQGKTESVEEFVEKLNIRCKNKVKKEHLKESLELTIREKTVLERKLKPLIDIEKKKKEKEIETSSSNGRSNQVDDYLKVFEEKFEKELKKKTPAPKKDREAKHQFPKEKKEKVKELSDMERWLKAFDS